MAHASFIRWSLFTAAAAIALTGTVRPGANRHLEESIDPRRPECPHDYRILRPAIDTGRNSDPIPVGVLQFPNGLSVPGPQTNVPEFNDCQRILIRSSNGALSYGPLMAVFASYRLDSLKIPKDTLSDDARIFAAVEVLNYSRTFHYPSLGIGPYFNCLYIYGTSTQLHARMRYVGAKEEQCADTFSPSQVPGNELAVIVTQAGYFNDSADYPPVARWDWDNAHGIQYIGVRCGNAWCEIGPGSAVNPAVPAFTPSPPYKQAPVSNTGGESGVNVGSQEDRLRAIKGWYDQQYLAIQSGNVATPTHLRGTVFPDTSLGKLTKQEFIENKWRAVSHIALEKQLPGPRVTADYNAALTYYKTKFNLDPVPAGSAISAMNHVLICSGTINTCHVPWPATTSMKRSCGNVALGQAKNTPRLWLKITSSVSDTMYRCATPYTHDGVEIPATARWRWLAGDETSWRKCPSGCCEMDGNQYAADGT